MTQKQYQKRQSDAKAELKKLGLYEKARIWVHQKKPPEAWKGTPLEYALEEMPVSPIQFLKNLVRAIAK